MRMRLPRVRWSSECKERADECVCIRRDEHETHECPCGAQWQRGEYFHVVSWPGSNAEWSGLHPEVDE